MRQRLWICSALILTTYLSVNSWGGAIAGSKSVDTQPPIDLDPVVAPLGGTFQVVRVSPNLSGPIAGSADRVAYSNTLGTSYFILDDPDRSQVADCQACNLDPP